MGYADGYNLYHYVHNNPLKYVDPMGTTGKEVTNSEPRVLTQPNYPGGANYPSAPEPSIPIVSLPTANLPVSSPSNGFTDFARGVGVGLLESQMRANFNEPLISIGNPSVPVIHGFDQSIADITEQHTGSREFVSPLPEAATPEDQLLSLIHI